MRVVHVVPARFGRGGIVGGAERYACELARAMADVVPTTLVTFGDENAVETCGALRLRTLGHPWYVRGQRCNPISLRLFDVLRPANGAGAPIIDAAADETADTKSSTTKRPQKGAATSKGK